MDMSIMDMRISWSVLPKHHVTIRESYEQVMYATPQATPQWVWLGAAARGQQVLLSGWGLPLPEPQGCPPCDGRIEDFF